MSWSCPKPLYWMHRDWIKWYLRFSKMLDCPFRQQFHMFLFCNCQLFFFFISEPTVTTIQPARDSSGHVQFGQEPYDLPKNGHIPSHYDLLPARETPSSDNMELDSEWWHRDLVSLPVCCSSSGCYTNRHTLYPQHTFTCFLAVILWHYTFFEIKWVYKSLEVSFEVLLSLSVIPHIKRFRMKCFWPLLMEKVFLPVQNGHNWRHAKKLAVIDSFWDVS